MPNLDTDNHRRVLLACIGHTVFWCLKSQPWVRLWPSYQIIRRIEHLFEHRCEVAVAFRIFRIVSGMSSKVTERSLYSILFIYAKVYRVYTYHWHAPMCQWFIRSTGWKYTNIMIIFNIYLMIPVFRYCFIRNVVSLSQCQVS